MIRAAGAWLKRRLVAMHRRLLPDDPTIGWTPYLWLFYVAFFYVSWAGRPPSRFELGLGVGTFFLFLFLYFTGYRRSGPPLRWNIAALTLLAMAWMPSRPSAMVFYIYAAGFCGAVGPPRIGGRILVLLVAVAAFFGLAIDVPWQWIAITGIMQGVIGLTNIYFAELARKNADLHRSRQEAEHFATLAERERIARDLHDLLGHTLSLITLKAELAGKLSRRGDERAADEIADVERISRDALRQVREAVAGFRRTGITGEVEQASELCRTRGIDFDAELEPLGDGGLSPRQESVLIMVLREAVTNVVRHSGASSARVRLARRQSGDEPGAADSQAREELVLTVEDDGKGGLPDTRGSGLKGMRERLEALGGALRIDHDGGWSLRASLPVQDDSRILEPTR